MPTSKSAKKPAKSRAQAAAKTKVSKPKDVMDWGQYYLVTKSPIQLPVAVKEGIVNFGPWALLVLAIFWLQMVVVILRIGSPGVSVVRQYMPSIATSFAFQSIFFVVQLAFLVIALPGLFKRRISGWNAMIVVVFINLLYNIYAANVPMGVVVALLSLYVLFQVRSYYQV